VLALLLLAPLDLFLTPLLLKILTERESAGGER